MTSAFTDDLSIPPRLPPLTLPVAFVTPIDACAPGPSPRPKHWVPVYYQRPKPRRWTKLDRKVAGYHLIAATNQTTLTSTTPKPAPLLSRPYRYLLALTAFALVAFGCVRLVVWAGRQALLG